MIEFPKMTVCKWCGDEMPNDPGAYYHKSRCEADWIRKELKTETDPVERKRLEAELERALYVGD